MILCSSHMSQHGKCASMPAADTLSDHGRLHARTGTVSCSDDRGIFQETEMTCNSLPLDESTSSALVSSMVTAC